MRGVYTLQAALAAVHARATRAADTDWQTMVATYDALLANAKALEFTTGKHGLRTAKHPYRG